MKSLKDFQSSHLGIAIPENVMLSIKGGTASVQGGPTGPSPAGGACTQSGNCATWTSDNLCGNGCIDYFNYTLINQNC